MGRSGELERTGIWRRFKVMGRADTVLTQNGSDVRQYQQGPIWSSTSSANTADRWHCKLFPHLLLLLNGNANGTVLLCSTVDM